MSENVTGIQAEFDASDTVVNETGTDVEPTEDGEFTIEELDPGEIPKNRTQDPNHSSMRSSRTRTRP